MVRGPLAVERAVTGREIAWCAAMLDALVLAWPGTLGLDALRTASAYPHSNAALVAALEELEEWGFLEISLGRDTLAVEVRATERLLVLMALLHRRHG